MFSANSVRVKEDGSPVYEPVAQYDPGKKKLVPVPIDIGPEKEQVYFSLYGTGIPALPSPILSRSGTSPLRGPDVDPHEAVWIKPGFLPSLSFEKKPDRDLMEIKV